MTHSVSNLCCVKCRSITVTVLVCYDLESKINFLSSLSEINVQLIFNMNVA